MVVLVLGTHIFPSGNNFVKELLKLHPEISTVVVNINEKRTSMVLGEREKVSYGKGAVYLFGFSVGYSYYMTGATAWLNFVDEILKGAGASKYELANALGGVYEKRLEKEDSEVVFLFNSSEEEKAFAFKKEVLSYGGDGRFADGKYILSAGSMGYVVLKKS